MDKMAKGRQTIESLDPLHIIVRKQEPSVASVGVNREHQSSRVSGVLKSQRVTKLMGSHKKQVVSYKKTKQTQKYLLKQYTHVSECSLLPDPLSQCLFCTDDTNQLYRSLYHLRSEHT